ncbi:Unknown protein sequence [Pseudomonas syringae pv. cilantro]|uniref:Uncharacterized protein n=2 Tax=Pseudomonas syringae group TaxID=136849 RepID=A0A0N0GCB0_PSESX|nr:Unknown protein sequence [Pseudomonas syringae pv. cilantro]RMN10423.1 hypothetical protein ALQ65_102370 [Pseudomonas syringae pv. coriandricola]
MPNEYCFKPVLHRRPASALSVDDEPTCPATSALAVPVGVSLKARHFFT